MSNLTVRVLSALVLLAAGFAALVFNLHARWAVITAILAIGAWEMSALSARKLAVRGGAWIPPAAVLALCAAHLPGWTAPPLWIWIVAVATLSALIAHAFARLPVTVMAPWIVINAFVAGYLGLWGAALFGLTAPRAGFTALAPLVFTIACIVAADTGAYFTGRAVGRRKLAPTISSGKTREGAVGGVAATLVVASLLAGFAGLSLAAALLLGAVLAAASVAGDLFLSAYKRWANAKDTSNIIPGHGGVMDRFDALVFAAPFAWLGFRLLG